jgi:hypothetical protein
MRYVNGSIVGAGAGVTMAGGEGGTAAGLADGAGDGTSIPAAGFCVRRR